MTLIFSVEGRKQTFKVLHVNVPIIPFYNNYLGLFAKHTSYQKIFSCIQMPQPLHSTELALTSQWHSIFVAISKYTMICNVNSKIKLCQNNDIIKRESKEFYS